MSEQRLIDKNELLNKFEKLKEKATALRDVVYLDGVIAVIDSTPTIEPVCGKWVEPVLLHCEYGCMCSKCEKFNDAPSNFCPSCGAEMGGKHDGVD